MKRTVVTLGLAAAVVLGAPAAAQASTGHHKQQGAAASPRLATDRAKAPAKAASCSVAKRCRPKPLPRPENGWPCKADHSCAKRHHYPVCPPTPPKPPVVVHPKPKPPAITPPKPVVHHDAPATRIPTPQLALTGVDPVPALLLSGGLIGSGSLLLLTGPIRKFTRKARAR